MNWKNRLNQLRAWRIGRRRTRTEQARSALPADGAGQNGDDRNGNGRNGNGRNGVIVVRGLGGRLEIDGHIIRIKRGGIVAFILTALGYQNAFLEKSIWIDRLSTIDIIQDFLALDYIRFCYPGSPNITGRPLQDALADNALLLNPFDHRPFYLLKAQLETLIRAIGDPHTLPGRPR